MAPNKKARRLYRAERERRNILRTKFYIKTGSNGRTQEIDIDTARAILASKGVREETEKSLIGAIKSVSLSAGIEDDLSPEEMLDALEKQDDDKLQTSINAIAELEAARWARAQARAARRALRTTIPLLRSHLRQQSRSRRPVTRKANVTAGGSDDDGGSDQPGEPPAAQAHHRPLVKLHYRNSQNDRIRRLTGAVGACPAGRGNR